MAGELRTAVELVAEARRELRFAERRYEDRVSEVNALCKNLEALESYARSLYPAEWALLDQPDSDPSTYTALNKAIRVVQKQMRHPEFFHVLSPAVEVRAQSYADFSAQELTVLRMRKKCGSIRRLRRKARIGAAQK